MKSMIDGFWRWSFIGSQHKNRNEPFDLKKFLKWNLIVLLFILVVLYDANIFREEMGKNERQFQLEVASLLACKNGEVIDRGCLVGSLSEATTYTALLPTVAFSLLYMRNNESDMEFRQLVLDAIERGRNLVNESNYFKYRSYDAFFKKGGGSYLMLLVGKFTGVGSAYRNMYEQFDMFEMAINQPEIYKNQLNKKIKSNFYQG